jgi:hypothetical protein
MGESIGTMAAEVSMPDDILNAPGPATAISRLRPASEISTPCCVGVKLTGGGGGGNATLHAARAKKRSSQRNEE